MLQVPLMLPSFYPPLRSSDDIQLAVGFEHDTACRRKNAAAIRPRSPSGLSISNSMRLCLPADNKGMSGKFQAGDPSLAAS